MQQQRPPENGNGNGRPDLPKREQNGGGRVNEERRKFNVMGNVADLGGLFSCAGALIAPKGLPSLCSAGRRRVPSRVNADAFFAPLRHCSEETLEDNLRRGLVGMTRSCLTLVERVKPGLPLFLFNLTNKRLYGVLEAVRSPRD